MEIIQSKLLSGNGQIIHGMSTKWGSPPFFNNLSRHVGDDTIAVKKNRNKFFGGLGIDQSRLVHANQIHSNNVRIVSEPGLYKETDGLITYEKNLFLVVSIADCLPIMIYDKKNRIAANIHAGWRGTHKKIAGRAMEILMNDCNSAPDDLFIFFGPCISQKNFEVDQEVAEMFDPRFVEKLNGKYRVDILKDNMAQVKAFGISDKSIESCNLCTYENSNFLHSYRRDKEKSGRMFAVIGMVL